MKVRIGRRHGAMTFLALALTAALGTKTWAQN
jgi:hypothetical protein